MHLQVAEVCAPAVDLLVLLTGLFPAIRQGVDATQCMAVTTMGHAVEYSLQRKDVWSNKPHHTLIESGLCRCLAD
jgi:hypothetical protein